jgi:DNA polymerase V
MTIFSIQNKTELELPYFDALIKAGFPAPVDDYSESKLDLNKYVVSHPQSTFFVKVDGDSMQGCGIYEGDIVVVDKILEAKSGNIVLAVVDGEFTLKRLQINTNTKQISLVPENPKYQPIIITNEMELQIWGVVTFTIHKPL